MCNFKSLLLTKDKAFCPDYDNHSRMIEELGLRDTALQPGFVKIEITPPNDDPFTPLDQWAYRVDQDYFPDWYAEEIDKPRAMAALGEWAKDRIFVGVNGLALTEGAGYYLKDCKDATLSGSSRVDCMVGSSRVDCMEGSSCVGCMEDSSRVGRMVGSSCVGRMVGSSRVGRMVGSSRVDDVYNNAKIGVASGTAVISTIGPTNFDWPNKAALILSENATYRNCIERTIYQSGDWKLALVADGTPIGGEQV
ncbi:MAG: hypothetical protein VB034_07415 [Eubacteriales bacterium]|nr:hypothetical protein [Eubacteriales bacterium]